MVGLQIFPVLLSYPALRVPEVSIQMHNHLVPYWPCVAFCMFTSSLLYAQESQAFLLHSSQETSLPFTPAIAHGSARSIPASSLLWVYLICAELQS